MSRKGYFTSNNIKHFFKYHHLQTFELKNYFSPKLMAKSFRGYELPTKKLMGSLAH